MLNIRTIGMHLPCLLMDFFPVLLPWSATLLDIMWFWQMVSGLGRVLYDLKRQKMVSPSADDKQKKTE